MVIFATHQSRFKTVGKISKENLEQSWKKATDGLKYAVNFLRENAGVDSLEYLSSPFLLIPIAVYWILKEDGALHQTMKRKCCGGSIWRT